MYRSIVFLLSKLDYRLTPRAFSRAQYQIELIIDKLVKLHKKKFNRLLDVGGGYDGKYKKKLIKITNEYQNLELEKGINVDIVGSVYQIPLKNNTVDLLTSFMVLEHLNEPKQALTECARVLKKTGLLAITTVQYWHTHNYPSDYYRYTKYGLEYILNKAGFKIISIWSHGGPFLIIFHVIELNIPVSFRTLFSIYFYKFFDWLDWIFFKHEDKRKPSNDSLGWSVIAQKI